MTALIDFAKIDLDEALTGLEAMANKRVIERHIYDIFYSESDDRWHSYLPDETRKSKRRPIAKRSRENLEKSIVEFYKSQSIKSAVTLEKLYPQWLEYKKMETTNGNAHKLDWSWNRYYKGDPLIKKNIRTLKVLDLKEWYLKKINEMELTNRQFKDMKSVLNMILDYAVEKEIVMSNVSRGVKGISYKKFRYVEPKPLNQQVFIDDEEAVFINTAIEQYQNTQNIAYLAVCLNFTLALRIGELAALQDTDFGDRTISIRRQEVKIFIEKDGKFKRNGYEVVPYTKTLNSERLLPLTSQAQRFKEMIIRAKQDQGLISPYLLVNKDGQRLNTDMINNALRRVNKKINTFQKGNHCIRKTCLSIMHSSHVLSDEEIRMFAGHKEISTTRNSYIFATESLENRQDAYEQAICRKIAN